jgi:hypothetical protein
MIIRGIRMKKYLTKLFAFCSEEKYLFCHIAHVHDKTF